MKYFYQILTVSLLIFCSCASETQHNLEKSVDRNNAPTRTSEKSYSERKETNKSVLQNDNVIISEKESYNLADIEPPEEVEEFEALFDEEIQVTLSNEEINAYNEQAVILFKNLIEFQEVVVDEQANNSLKKQALKMSQSLFTKDAYFENSKGKKVRIEKFIKEEIKLYDLESLGEFRFVKQIDGVNKAGIYEIEIKNEAKKLKVFYELVSTKKQFGRKKISVNKVLLSKTQEIDKE